MDRLTVISEFNCSEWKWSKFDWLYQNYLLTVCGHYNLDEVNDEDMNRASTHAMKLAIMHASSMNHNSLLERRRRDTEKQEVEFRRARTPDSNG